MRPRGTIVLFVIVFYGLSALVQWAMWRWWGTMAPEFTRHHRKKLLAALSILFVMPFFREATFLWPALFPRSGAGALRPMLTALGILWYLTVWMSMAAIGAGRGLRWAFERWAASRSKAPGPASPPPPAPELVSVNSVISLPSSPSRRMALERIGGAAAFAVSGSMLGWGTLRGRFDWVIEEVPIRLARLPKALDGFTIVQVSDIHVGSFVQEGELRRGLGLIERARPDLIVITGDIVDSDATFVELAARRLGALSARYGVYCIPGNHDYYTGIDAVLPAMARAGIEVMKDRGKVIAPHDGGGFALLGVDDLWAKEALAGSGGPDLARAKAMVSPDLATVLLAHQPRFVPTARAEGIDLQLSGHTHGGQINPGFRPADLFMTYVAGRYEVGPTQLYVNRGFGTAGPPARVGAAPEISKIVLVSG